MNRVRVIFFHLVCHQIFGDWKMLNLQKNVWCLQACFSQKMFIRVAIENISEQLRISAHTKLCMMTLPFLRSVVEFQKCWPPKYKAPYCNKNSGNQLVWLKTATKSSLQSRSGPHWFLFIWLLKEFLHGTKFSSSDEVKSTVSKWLKTQFKDFYAEGIQKFIFWWEMCFKE